MSRISELHLTCLRRGRKLPLQIKDVLDRLGAGEIVDDGGLCLYGAILSDDTGAVHGLLEAHRCGSYPINRLVFDRSLYGGSYEELRLHAEERYLRCSYHIKHHAVRVAALLGPYKMHHAGRTADYIQKREATDLEVMEVAHSGRNMRGNPR